MFPWRRWLRLRSEVVQAMHPYYIIRALGGMLYLGGTLVMAFNLWKTIRGDVPVAAVAPAPIGSRAGDAPLLHHPGAGRDALSRRHLGDGLQSLEDDPRRCSRGGGGSGSDRKSCRRCTPITSSGRWAGCSISAAPW